MERMEWTDERLTESFDLLRADIADLRGEMRTEIRDLRMEIRAIMLVLVTGLLGLLTAVTFGA